MSSRDFVLEVATEELPSGPLYGAGTETRPAMNRAVSCKRIRGLMIERTMSCSPGTATATKLPRTYCSNGTIRG